MTAQGQQNFGVTFSIDIKWNDNVTGALQKVKTHLYLLSPIRCVQVKAEDLTIHTTYMESLMEYVYLRFHNCIPQQLSNDLENCQKCAVRNIFSSNHYDQALKEFVLICLYERRETITKSLFEKICVPEHGLYNLWTIKNDYIE